jgi:hypothetical protein
MVPPACQAAWRRDPSGNRTRLTPRCRHLPSR